MRKIILISFLVAILTNAYAGKIDTIKVMSKSMNKLVPNLVIIPDNYQNQKEGFPTLYLLHGATGNFKSWLSIEPDLASYADKYNMIIICPDGGFTSWYYDSPIDSTMKYETYVSKE